MEQTPHAATSIDPNIDVVMPQANLIRNVSTTGPLPRQEILPTVLTNTSLTLADINIAE